MIDIVSTFEEQEAPKKRVGSLPHQLTASFYTIRCREVGQQVNALLKDDKFQAACDKAGINPTRRQARKWLRHQGLAYRTLSSRVDS